MCDQHCAQAKVRWRLWRKVVNIMTEFVMSAPIFILFLFFLILNTLIVSMNWNSFENSTFTSVGMSWI